MDYDLRDLEVLFMADPDDVKESVTATYAMKRKRDLEDFESESKEGEPSSVEDVRKKKKKKKKSKIESDDEDPSRCGSEGSGATEDTSTARCKSGAIDDVVHTAKKVRTNDPERMWKREKVRAEYTMLKAAEEGDKDSEKFGGVAEASLEYLRTWHEDRKNWSFRKVRQVWLLKNMYDRLLIGKSDFKIFLLYLDGLKGAARQTTLEGARHIVEDSDSEDETKTKTQQVKTPAASKSVFFGGDGDGDEDDEEAQPDEEEKEEEEEVMDEETRKREEERHEKERRTRMKRATQILRQLS